MEGRKDDAISWPLIQFPKGISDILATLPSVKYYCQSSILGPISLTTVLHKPLIPHKSPVSISLT
jgi:hypothetical protein